MICSTLTHPSITCHATKQRAITHAVITQAAITFLKGRVEGGGGGGGASGREKERVRLCKTVCKYIAILT